MKEDSGLAGWLQLTLTPGLGAAAIRGMLQQFGLPQNVLARSSSELSRYAPADTLKSLSSNLYGSEVYSCGQLGIYGEFGGDLTIPATNLFLDIAPFPF